MSLADTLGELHAIVAARVPQTAPLAGAADLAAAAELLRPLADALRTDASRAELGATELPRLVVQVLRAAVGQSSPQAAEASVQAMRTLANLAIDCAGNRDVLLEVGAAQPIIALLSQHHAAAAPFSPSVLAQVRTAAGALLNLTLEHAAAQRALRSPQALHALAGLVCDARLYVPLCWTREPGTEWEARQSTATWLARVLGDACAVEESEDRAGEADDRPDEDKATVGLEQMSLHAEPLETLCEGQGYTVLFSPLLPFLNPPDVPAELDTDAALELLSSDIDLMSSLLVLFDAASRRSASFRTRAMLAAPELEGHTQAMPACPLALLTRFLDVATLPRTLSGPPEQPTDEAKAFALVKADAARALVGISAADENMEALFGSAGESAWFVELCREWLGRQDRSDLQSTALLGLGNLARKDEHCLALAQHTQLLPTLLSLLGASAPAPKLVYGAVGLLKNLAIPAPNKITLGERFVPAVVPFLAAQYAGVQPLQFATVGLLKHLVAGVPENAICLVDPKTATEAEAPLAAVLELIERTQDAPTRLEGTRILVNALRTLFAASAAGDSEDERRRRAEARSRFVRAPVANALAAMLGASSKYPILTNEAIFALTLLAAESQGQPLVLDALFRTQDEESDERSPRAPQRQGTADSAASTRTEVPKTPKTACDRLRLVLWTPSSSPAIVANACTLVSTLLESYTADTLDDKSRSLVQQVAGPVRELARQGRTQEAGERRDEGAPHDAAAKLLARLTKLGSREDQ